METEMRIDQSESNYSIGTSGPNIDEILALLQEFYITKDPTQREIAHNKLTTLQNSPHVWEICWQLLDPNLSTSEEVQFFSANTIYHKINQNWSQLDKEWLETKLRPRLFEILCNYAGSDKGYKLVTERLSLALATFAVHSIPSFWPEAIEQILQALIPANTETVINRKKMCDILFKILAYIPEEYSVLIPQQGDRAKLNYNMTKSGPIVFKFLYSLLTTKDPQLMSSVNVDGVLRCFTSWTLHSQTSLLELDMGKEILDVIYNLIPDEELCSSACAAIGATFNISKAENYRNTVMSFIPKIAQLKPVVDHYKNEDDIESAIKVYSLIINFAENHSRLFLKIVLCDDIQIPHEWQTTLKRDILDIIQLILECSAAPGSFAVDEKYSDMTFPFWFSFLENFYYYSDSFNDMICEIFNPLVDMLLVISLQKLRYPSAKAYAEVWTDEQREAFRCYRQDTGDNISLLINFPRSRDRILAKLRQVFMDELQGMTQNEIIDRDQCWQGLEAAIFSLKSISESIAFDEVQHVPDILTAMNQIPFDETHRLLYCSACEMISAFSDWLYAHGTYLASAFGILFKGITSPSHEMRLFSTLSLKDLTSECQAVLHPYAVQIVNSCSEAVHRAGLASISGDVAMTCEKARLMHTIGTSLPMCPQQIIIPTLSNVITPFINDLRASLENQDPQLEPMRRQVVLDRLTMLHSLIEAFHIKHSSNPEYEADGDENDPRYDSSRFEQNQDEVDITKPAIELLKEYLPVLSAIASRYKEDSNIIDVVTSTTKRCCRSLGADIKPVLEHLLKLIVLSYDPLLNPQLLDGLLPVYNLFKKDASVQSALQDAFKVISEQTLNACMGTALQNLSITIEIYFRFATSVCKRFTDFLTDPQFHYNMQLIYKLAVESLELPEKRTLAEVCNFLQQFRAKSIGVNELHNMMLSNLEVLLRTIFNVMGGIYSTPRNAVEHAIDLFYAIIDADEIREPLKAIVARPQFPTQFVSEQQKARFVQLVIHERNRRKFKDHCGEFVLLARNLHRN